MSNSKRSVEINDSDNNHKASKPNEHQESNIATLVHLKVNGTRDEVSMDINQAPTFLGGDIQFYGSWDEINVIIITKSNQKDERTPINNSKLQPPFHKAKIRGDILLMKTNENGLRTDFSLKEYEEFLKLDIEEWELQEDEGEVEGDADEEDEDEVDFFDSILESSVAEICEQLHRDLTEDELQFIPLVIDFIKSELDSMPGVEQQDLKVLSELKVTVQKWFHSTYGRESNENEDIMMSKIVDIFISAINEEEMNNQDGDQQAANDSEYLQVVKTHLIKSFVDEIGREPTDAELEELEMNAVNIMEQSKVDDEDEGEDEYDEGKADEEDEEAEEND